MDIVLFSAQETVKKQFSRLSRSRTHSVIHMRPEELKGFVKTGCSPALIYIDMADFSLDECKKHIASLRGSAHLRFGIIDKKNAVRDVAELFHKGAVDYLNQSMLQEQLTTKRINSVLEFRRLDEEEDTGKDTDAQKWKIAPGGWSSIKFGEEYTFFLLYIELDMIDEWRKKSGKDHIEDLQDRFHRHLERYFAAPGGKIWMWMNHGGVLLFPFDGTSCDPVTACIRLILNKTIISIEEFDYDTTITYKMALHLGNTVYEKRGKTGDIVSDTINSLFHIGKQYAKPGNFYLSGSVMPYLPEGLQSMFISEGRFEGHELYAMLLPKD